MPSLPPLEWLRDCCRREGWELIGSVRDADDDPVGVAVSPEGTVSLIAVPNASTNASFIPLTVDQAERLAVMLGRCGALLRTRHGLVAARISGGVVLSPVPVLASSADCPVTMEAVLESNGDGGCPLCARPALAHRSDQDDVLPLTRTVHACSFCTATWGDGNRHPLPLMHPLCRREPASRQVPVEAVVFEDSSIGWPAHDFDARCAHDVTAEGDAELRRAGRTLCVKCGRVLVLGAHGRRVAGLDVAS